MEFEVKCHGPPAHAGGVMSAISVFPRSAHLRPVQSARGTIGFESGPNHLARLPEIADFGLKAAAMRRHAAHPEEALALLAESG